MNNLKLAAAIALLCAAPSLPSSAADLQLPHHRYAHHHGWGLPYSISYVHNYGPGPVPNSFAYYDGPSTNWCYRGSAGYLGQDHRRHPCF